MKRQFIDGKEKNGLLYDYDLIRKEYKKLGCPGDVYSPEHLPLESSKWFITMSERSRGKTTNLLLLGLVFNKLYGTEIAYMRTREDMITKKNIEKLFNVIVEFGYVEKLTDGRYNSIRYNARKFYYCHVEDGEIIEQSDKAVCLAVSIDKAEVYKSSLALPYTDIIIFDEFIERWYYPQQFLMMMDLIKTIARDRFSVSIFLCANTIDKESPYFNEFEIRDEIEPMTQGESSLVTTKKGTNVYIEILGQKPPKVRKKQNLLNKLYYGFSNNKLSAITGAETWAVASYPHTPENFVILDRRRYIQFNNKLFNMELCRHKDYNCLFINIHPATKTYDDSIIYTLDFDMEPQHRYKFGYTKRDKKIWDMYPEKFTYSDNSVGSAIEKYIDIGTKQK